MKGYLKLMRVKHYMKNLLILLPAILTQKLFELPVLGRVMAGAVLFSLMSSVIYIVNDIKDVDADRKHPVKCRRPLASGAVSVRAAGCLAIILSATMVFVWGGVKFKPRYMLAPLLYLLINVAYSVKLKEYPLIDVSILMLGYLLRLVYGGILADTGVSAWMFLTVTAGAFFLGFGKRRNELMIYGDAGRANLRLYTVEFLDRACQMSMTTTVIFYALSCADANTAVAGAGVDLLWSVPVVFIICLRYLMILNDGKSDGDPVEVILKDKCLAALCVVYFVALMALLYGGLE